MTIRFEVCPYHEPSPVSYERTMVVDDYTRRFKCAVCNIDGTLLSDGTLPPDTVRKNSDGDYVTDFGVIDGGYSKHSPLKETSNA